MIFSRIQTAAALIALTAAGAVCAAPAAKTEMTDLAACYQKAGKSADKTGACLKQELEGLKKEYKLVTDRVIVIAKGQDKAAKTKERSDSFIRATPAFETYVTRECEFLRKMTKGNKAEVANAELACKVNLYRMRIDMLENRFLSAEQQ